MTSLKFLLDRGFHLYCDYCACRPNCRDMRFSIYKRMTGNKRIFRILSDNVDFFACDNLEEMMERLADKVYYEFYEYLLVSSTTRIDLLLRLGFRVYFLFDTTTMKLKVTKSDSNELYADSECVDLFQDTFQVLELIDKVCNHMLYRFSTFNRDDLGYVN